MQTDAAEPIQQTKALPIPVTFAGTVAFSRKSASWFLLGWLCTAALASATCLWFVHARWVPVFEATIDALPSDLKMNAGVLEAFPEGELVQQQNGFISLLITPSRQSQGNMTADFQIAATPNELRFRSLLGYLSIPYPVGAEFKLLHSDVKPWWRAREALFTVLAFCVVSSALLATWTLLATLYFFPIAIANFFATRRNEFWATWRLAGSLLLPGALIMTLSILLYGFHLLGFLGLLVATALHFVIAWIYGVATIKHIPPIPSTPRSGTNPFSDSGERDSSHPDPKFGD